MKPGNIVTKMVTYLLVLLQLGVVLGERCPAPTDIQSDAVKNDFNMTNFLGTYYEIAYHDYTQPRAICGCQRSVKTMNVTKEPDRIYDDFTLNCGNRTGNETDVRTYHNNLSFKMTDTPGYWVGKWPLFKDVAFPDTLVDFGPVVPELGQYAWVLEF